MRILRKEAFSRRILSKTEISGRDLPTIFLICSSCTGKDIPAAQESERLREPQCLSQNWWKGISTSLLCNSGDNRMISGDPPAESGGYLHTMSPTGREHNSPAPLGVRTGALLQCKLWESFIFAKIFLAC